MVYEGRKNHPILARRHKSNLKSLVFKRFFDKSIDGSIPAMLSFIITRKIGNKKSLASSIRPGRLS